MDLDLTAFSHRVAQQLPQVLDLFLFRLQPFVAYACIARRVPVTGKALALLTYGVLAFAQFKLGYSLTDIGATWLGLAYFALLAPAVYVLRDGLEKQWIDRKGLFLACFVAFMGVPSLLVPEPYTAIAVVFGWDVLLSSFSYCVDAPSSRQRRSLGDCYFFLLVNPTLVYPEQGKRIGDVGLHGYGLLRVTQGLAGLVLRCGLIIALAAYMTAPQEAGPFTPPGYLDGVRYYGLLAFGLWLTHSSVASIQIGLMRMIGWKIPERYDWPLFATGPVDFWRRWNIWVGQWARRYVFYPVNLDIRRRLPKLPSWIAQVPAVILVFGFVGLQHDVAAYLSVLKQEARVSIAITVGFLVACALFILALAAQRLLVRAVRGWSPKGSARVLMTGLRWFVFAHALLACGWLTQEVVRHVLAAPLVEIFPWVGWKDLA